MPSLQLGGLPQKSHQIWRLATLVPAYAGIFERKTGWPSEKIFPREQILNRADLTDDN